MASKKNLNGPQTLHTVKYKPNLHLPYIKFIFFFKKNKTERKEKGHVVIYRIDVGI